MRQRSRRCKKFYSFLLLLLLLLLLFLFICTDSLRTEVALRYLIFLIKNPFSKARSPKELVRVVAAAVVYFVNWSLIYARRGGGAHQASISLIAKYRVLLDCVTSSIKGCRMVRLDFTTCKTCATSTEEDRLRRSEKPLMEENINYLVFYRFIDLIVTLPNRYRTLATFLTFSKDVVHYICSLWLWRLTNHVSETL